MHIGATRNCATPPSRSLAVPFTMTTMAHCRLGMVGGDLLAGLLGDRWRSTTSSRVVGSARPPDRVPARQTTSIAAPGR